MFELSIDPNLQLIVKYECKAMFLRFMQAKRLLLLYKEGFYLTINNKLLKRVVAFLLVAAMMAGMAPKTAYADTMDDKLAQLHSYLYGHSDLNDIVEWLFKPSNDQASIEENGFGLGALAIVFGTLSFSADSRTMVRKLADEIASLASSNSDLAEFISYILDMTGASNGASLGEKLYNWMYGERTNIQRLLATMTETIQNTNFPTDTVDFESLKTVGNALSNMNGDFTKVLDSLEDLELLFSTLEFIGEFTYLTFGSILDTILANGSETHTIEELALLFAAEKIKNTNPLLAATLEAAAAQKPESYNGIISALLTPQRIKDLLQGMNAIVVDGNGSITAVDYTKMLSILGLSDEHANIIPAIDEAFTDIFRKFNTASDAFFNAEQDLPWYMDKVAENAEKASNKLDSYKTWLPDSLVDEINGFLDDCDDASEYNEAIAYLLNIPHTENAESIWANWEAALAGSDTASKAAKTLVKIFDELKERGDDPDDWFNQLDTYLSMDAADFTNGQMAAKVKALLIFLDSLGISSEDAKALGESIFNQAMDAISAKLSGGSFSSLATLNFGQVLNMAFDNTNGSLANWELKASAEGMLIDLYAKAARELQDILDNDATYEAFKVNVGKLYDFGIESIEASKDVEIEAAKLAPPEIIEDGEAHTYVSLSTTQDEFIFGDDGWQDELKAIGFEFKYVICENEADSKKFGGNSAASAGSSGEVPFMIKENRIVGDGAEEQGKSYEFTVESRVYLEFNGKSYWFTFASKVIAIDVPKAGKPVVEIAAIPNPIESTSKDGAANPSVTLTASETSGIPDVQLSYQWYSNTTDSTAGGTELTGETRSTLAAALPDYGPNYFYYVVVTNTDPEAPLESIKTTSEVATIVINAAAPVFTVQPESASINVLNQPSAEFKLIAEASVSDDGILTYTWYSCEDATLANPAKVGDGPTYAPPTNSVSTRYYYVAASNFNNDVNGEKTIEARSEKLFGYNLSDNKLPIYDNC
jgi:hypothetical protein